MRTIGEVTTQVATWNPSRSTSTTMFDYIDLSAVDNDRKRIVSPVRISSKDAPSRARQIVAAGDVLVSTVRPNLNAVAVVPPSLAGATASTGFTVLRAREELHSRYLFHWTRSVQFIDEMVRKATGASYPAVSDRIVKQSTLPLPPLDEQRRIAAILDQADTLRSKRRRALADLDDLTQSIFHDTFDHNPGEYQMLGRVADFFGGTSLPDGVVYEGNPDGTLLMKVSDMNSPGNEDDVIATALWTDRPTPRSATVAAGAVVLPKRGASIATNKKRLTTRRTALDPNLMGVQPRAGVITSRYLYEWFKSFDLVGITSGSAVPQLNKQDLAPILIPVPDMVRQAKLEDRLGAVNLQRSIAKQAHAAAVILLTSLQDRAFQGQL